MFHFITMADQVNYADDNTICSEQPTKQQVVEVLRVESNLAIEWFTRNLMLANPQKFQALFLNCNRKILHLIFIMLLKFQTMLWNFLVYT